MALKISSGFVNRPQKVAMYGSEGIGKTKTASRFPDPLFIDTEGGTSHIDVKRTQKPADWNELIEIIEDVANTPDICKTLVIDTADWAEALAIEDICTKMKVDSIESIAYGKGYSYVGQYFGKMLGSCDKVIASGKNVVIVAHAKMRKFEQPDELGAYDRWEMKLTKQSAPLLKEWADMLLFLNYKTYVVATDTASKKVQGGKRVMYATHHPCWDAKNRHNLPDEMEMDYKCIAHIFENVVTPKKEEPQVSKFYEQVRTLLVQSECTEEELRRVVSQKGHFSYETEVKDYPDDFFEKWVIPNWPNIVSVITTFTDHIPF